MSSSEELFSKFGKTFSKGSVLFLDGDDSREMYIIQKGKVKISKKVRDVEKTLIVLGEAEFFGEMATLNNKPRSASATVVEDSELLVIDPGTFEAMVLNSTEVALKMIKKLAQRLQEADDQIENLMLKDNNSKVVNILIRLAYSSGEKVDGGIKIRISPVDLAAKVGIEPRVIKEVVIKLVRGKILKVVADGLVVSSIDDLTKYLSFLTMKEKFNGMG